MKKVKITILRKTLIKDLAEEYGAENLGPCPMLREGQVFYADYAKPEGLCDEAWKAILAAASSMLRRMPSKPARLPHFSRAAGVFFSLFLRNKKDALILLPVRSRSPHRCPLLRV